MVPGIGRLGEPIYAQLKYQERLEQLKRTSALVRATSRSEINYCTCASLRPVGTGRR